MAVGLSSAQRTYLGMINQTLAVRPKWQYLPPAIPLAIIHIESDDDPLAGPNGAGRYDGLGQVIPATAVAMAALYGIQAAPQTNPMVSIQSCIAYLDDSARSIIRFRNTLSLSVWDLMVAYNEGFGAVEQGRLDSAYLAKSQAALPIIEQQMAAVAKRASFMPNMARVLTVPGDEMGIYTMALLQRGLMPLTMASA